MTPRKSNLPGSCRDGGRAVCDNLALCTLPYRKRRISVHNCTSERNESRSGKDHQDGEDGHLTAKNKWLLGHPEGGLPEGSPMGLIGENLSLD